MLLTVEMDNATYRRLLDWAERHDRTVEEEIDALVRISTARPAIGAEFMTYYSHDSGPR